MAADRAPHMPPNRTYVGGFAPCCVATSTAVAHPLRFHHMSRGRRHTA